jgi:hypothetical protein
LLPSSTLSKFSGVRSTTLLALAQARRAESRRKGRRRRAMVMMLCQSN